MLHPYHLLLHDPSTARCSMVLVASLVSIFLLSNNVSTLPFLYQQSSLAQPSGEASVSIGNASGRTSIETNKNSLSRPQAGYWEGIVEGRWEFKDPTDHYFTHSGRIDLRLLEGNRMIGQSEVESKGYGDGKLQYRDTLTSSYEGSYNPETEIATLDGEPTSCFSVSEGEEVSCMPTGEMEPPDTERSCVIIFDREKEACDSQNDTYEIKLKDGAQTRLEWKDEFGSGYSEIMIQGAESERSIEIDEGQEQNQTRQQDNLTAIKADNQTLSTVGPIIVTNATDNATSLAQGKLRIVSSTFIEPGSFSVGNYEPIQSNVFAQNKIIQLYVEYSGATREQPDPSASGETMFVTDVSATYVIADENGNVKASYNSPSSPLDSISKTASERWGRLFTSRTWLPPRTEIREDMR